MKIYAPVKDANGVYASVRFVNGVGETDNPRLIKWFEMNGYTVEMSQKSLEKCVEMSQNSLEKSDEELLNLVIEQQIDEIAVENDEVEMMGYETKQPDFDAMTPIELRDWAKANGFGSKIKSIRNKEKLIEILRG